MSKAWILPTLASSVVLVGCGSDPEPVTEVPPPPVVAEPEPLPPVSVNEGSSVTTDPVGPDTGVTIGPGPGTAYQPEPLPPTQPVTRTYTIQKGDTLWSIAKRTYGNGQRWKDISAANPSLDPKKLLIGTQIILP